VNWNIYLKAADRQAANQALASHDDVQKGNCPKEVVALVSQAIFLLPDPPIPQRDKDGKIIRPFFGKLIEITTNGQLDLVDGKPQPADIAHCTIMVALVPAPLEPV
jgi:hypothetical protein